MEDSVEVGCFVFVVIILNRNGLVKVVVVVKWSNSLLGSSIGSFSLGWLLIL